MLKESVRCVCVSCGLLIRKQLHLVNEASHTVLLEAGVSLADILKERNLLPPEEGYPLDRMAPVPSISALISREQAKMAAHASTQVWKRKDGSSVKGVAVEVEEAALLGILGLGHS